MKKSVKTGSENPDSAEALRAGNLYLDASAATKLYVSEPESDALNQALRGRRDLILSDLAVTEVASAFARRWRKGLLSAEMAARFHNTLLGHVESGLFLGISLTPEVHRAAERILLSMESIPLRAADSLHLALALAAGARVLITFDQRLAQAARRMGLNTPTPSAF